MKQTMLVTLRHAGMVRTLAYDEEVQPTLYVGLDSFSPGGEALVRIDAHPTGLVVRPCGGLSLLPTGTDEPSPAGIAVERGASAMLALRGDELSDETSLYLRPATAGLRRWHRYGVARDAQLVVGRDQSCALWYASRFVSARHCKLENRTGGIWVTDLGSGNGTYVDGKRLEALQPHLLASGSVVQVLDLCVMAGEDLVFLNDPWELRLQAGASMRPIAGSMSSRTTSRLAEKEQSHAAFYPAPRIMRTVSPVVCEVEPPPSHVEPPSQSLLAHMGPTFLMGMTSVFMAANAVSGFADGKDVWQVAPSIAMAVAMLGGSVVWPVLSHARDRRLARVAEERRVRLYAAYLDKVERDLEEQATQQAQILAENRVPVADLMRRAAERSSLLMSHAATDDDFLQLRVGVGEMPLEAQLAWPARRLAVEEDELWTRVAALESGLPPLRNVPLALDLVRHAVVGVLGERVCAWEFMRGLLVQLCANHSPNELKLVLLVDEAEREEWAFLQTLPHLHDDTGDQRRIALTPAGAMRMDRLLLQELEARNALAQPHGLGFVHYVVVCSSTLLRERSQAIRRVLELRGAPGICVLLMGRHLQDLPRDCGYIVDLDANLGEEGGRARGAAMFERSDLSGSMVRFEPDVLVSRSQARGFARDLASVRLDLRGEADSLAIDLGFLELYEAGCVEHLDIGQRWAHASAARSLEAPLGRDCHGSVVSLDLGESGHGPHGLVAGTTGSGKSELIITLILGLCVSYPPDEVSFALIDYKGGGLAGAFGNERHHLPHLAGTITNLDGSAIRRSLASLKGELLRRQEVLNHARSLTGEATMDIYRYLSLRKQGVLEEPLPHLVVIADEFAELRQQEPEFMEELMSAARIGRSLGVHLVLATQKPSGVVNDQIWSNARFKICLKVAQRADSREMIRRDDAANISNPGRFCMLVGYDESFVVAQAAYAGRGYAPQERYEPRRDRDVELLDAEGMVVARRHAPQTSTTHDLSELNAVLAHIEHVARASGRVAPQLWLDPLPRVVTLADLDERYGALPADAFACALAEVDDPVRQRRLRLEVDLDETGNVALLGNAGSGAEGILRAMVCGLAQRFDASRLWVYGLEAAGDALAAIASLPQVGDVISMMDEERVWRLLHVLQAELERRKAARAHRIRGAGPRILVVLASPETLFEETPEVEERLVVLTREGPAVDMHVVMLARSATSLHMRLRSNFGSIVPLALNDETDYLSVLGSLEGMAVPKGEGRGIVRQGGDLMEFQGASIGRDEDDEARVLAQIVRAARMRGGTSAPSMPVLPHHVRVEHVLCTNAHAWPAVAGRLSSRPDSSCTQIPLGMDRTDATPICVDSPSVPGVLVTGNDGTSLSGYARGLHEACARRGTAHMVLDAAGLMGVSNDSEVAMGVSQVEQFVRELDEDMRPIDVLVVVGIIQTFELVSDQTSQRLKSLVTRGTDGSSSAPALVAVSESWRLLGVYEDWYRVLQAQLVGVWIGSGFAEQTVLRFTPPLPRCRGAMTAMDGYVVQRGDLRAVRMLEG